MVAKASFGAQTHFSFVETEEYCCSCSSETLIPSKETLIFPEIYLFVHEVIRYVVDPFFSMNYSC